MSLVDLMMYMYQYMYFCEVKYFYKGMVNTVGQIMAIWEYTSGCI